jgi:catechol 2,3-dioxygenase-like lactoylglutathione lyase family enzyme
MGTETKATTHLTDVGTVGIPVADHDRAIEFYVGKLGFEKRMDAEFAPGFRWVEVAPPSASTSVALCPASEETPAGVDTGIRLASTDAVADHAALVARGVDADEEVLRWEGVPPMFSFRDPDGNRLYVVER